MEVSTTTDKKNEEEKKKADREDEKEKADERGEERDAVREERGAEGEKYWPSIEFISETVLVDYRGAYVPKEEIGGREIRPYPRRGEQLLVEEEGAENKETP